MLFDNEPEIQPDDTKPTMTIPVVDVDMEAQPRSRSRLWGALSLIGALIFTVGTVALLIAPPADTTPTPPQQVSTLDVTAAPQETRDALPSPTVALQNTPIPFEAGYVLPTASVEEVYALLQAA